MFTLLQVEVGQKVHIYSPMKTLMFILLNSNFVTLYRGENMWRGDMAVHEQDDLRFSIKQGTFLQYVQKKSQFPKMD